MSEIQLPERVLSLDGAHNVRDIGGYPTRDGRRTRWQMLLRGDSPHRLSPLEVQRLLEYGVRTVVDLRDETELTAAPSPFTGGALAYYHNPLFPRRPTGSLERPVAPPTLLFVYKMLFDGSQPALKAAVEHVLDSDGAALVHCTAGKDRTGVLVALLLDAVGVEADAIITDYALTGTLIAPLLPSLRAGRPPIFEPEDYEPLLEAREETMRDTLRHLYQKYGGGAAYLRAIGLSEAQVAALRGKLVE